MITTTDTKKLRKQLKRATDLEEQHSHTVQDMCKKELEQFKKAQEKLVEKLDEIRKNPNVRELEKQSNIASRNAQHTMQTICQSYQNALDDIYFENITKEEKDRKTNELMAHARKQLEDLSKDFPSMGKANMLMIL